MVVVDLCSLRFLDGLSKILFIFQVCDGVYGPVGGTCFVKVAFLALHGGCRLV
jgi:hypothetical protein